MSSFEMAAKAAILFHRAAHLTGQWTPRTFFLLIRSYLIIDLSILSSVDLSPRDRGAYEAAARSVNMLIESFRVKLGPLPTYTQDPSLRMSILTHALIDAASIKLHWIFAYAYSTSKQICLTAARNMVNYHELNLQDVGHMNPIMGVSCLSCH